MNVDYKCVFLHNQHATLTLQAARLWIAAEVAGGANSALALDNIGVTVLANATAQAGANTTEDTLPAGAGVFSSPTTKAGGILIGNIPAGSVVAIWLRRSATNSAAQNSDGLTFRVEGDTAS